MYNEDRRGTEASRKVDRWEKHMSTILQILVTAALMWIGTTLVNVRQDVAIMKSRMPGIVEMQKEMNELTRRVERNSSDIRGINRMVDKK